MIESDSKLCILQHTKNLAEFVISNKCFIHCPAEDKAETIIY